MSTEESCAKILGELLPMVDAAKAGDFIEIGCGTFAYYFETFARLGFRTFAVEPIPAPNLREACRRSGTPLEEVCVAETDGEKTMFIGQFQNHDNLNLSSLIEDWWGSSGKRVQVKSVTLATLLGRLGSSKITGLKIDVEGAEAIILRQLPELSPELLPAAVMFEYGGGDDRKSGAKGWSEKFLGATMECLEILKKSGYSKTLVVDSVAPAKILDLATISRLDPTAFFPSDANYGNIIAFHQLVKLPPLDKFTKEAAKPPAQTATRIELIGRTAGGAPVISFKKS